MNKTLLLALLTRCKEAILKEQDYNHESFYGNATTVTPTQTIVTNLVRQSYDNAYFYILFVMFIYSFLALILFRSFLQYKGTKKDPYGTFKGSAVVVAHKYSEGSAAEKFDFEEENII